MQDNPMPPIPEKARPALAWVSWLLFLGLPAAGGFVASMDGCKLKTALIVLLSVLGSFAAAIKTGLARPGGPKPPSPPAVAVLVLAVMATGCGLAAGGDGSLSAGYRTVIVVRKATDKTDHVLSEACSAQRRQCAAKFHLATSAGQACTADCRAALNEWRRYIRPTLQMALDAAFRVLEAARAAGRSHAGWMAMLTPGVCAHTKASRRWWRIAGPRLRIILAPVMALEGFTCA
jgi:hypothetical protein